MGEKEALDILLVAIGVADIGKQRWYEEPNALYYDRREHDYITFEEMICRAEEVLKYM